MSTEFKVRLCVGLNVLKQQISKGQNTVAMGEFGLWGLGSSWIMCQLRWKFGKAFKVPYKSWMEILDA